MLRATILAVTLATTSLSALAQGDPDTPQCAPKERMLSELKKSFREMPMWFGMGQTGKPMLLTFSADTGTWTLLIGAVAGKVELLCAVASGENGNMIDVKPDDGSTAD